LRFFFFLLHLALPTSWPQLVATNICESDVIEHAAFLHKFLDDLFPSLRQRPFIKSLVRVARAIGARALEAHWLIVAQRLIAEKGRAVVELLRQKHAKKIAKENSQKDAEKEEKEKERASRDRAPAPSSLRKVPRAK
jgi:hypothetical protein